MPIKQQRIQVICMNPLCSEQNQRCLDSFTLQKHSKQCTQHFFLADQIKNKQWTQIQNYPSDNLGKSIKQKYISYIIKDSKIIKTFISQSIKQVKQKINNELNKLQKKLSQLYPFEQMQYYYKSVYDLSKISQYLRLNETNKTLINKVINSNFIKPKYQTLLMLNQNYDDIKNMISNLQNNMKKWIQQIIVKHTGNIQNFNQMQIKDRRISDKQYVKINKNKYKNHKQIKQIKYDLVKSKFIHSSNIQFNNGQITFPKIKNIASFLPWIYGQKSFSSGIHELKISSSKFPIIQNAGFCILQNQDSDTYPYQNYKSLFNKQGKGFKLIKGDNIQSIIMKSTVMILRLQLVTEGFNNCKAFIFDSEMKSVYQCSLKQKTQYKLGIYGCGWTVALLELT